MNPNLTVEIVGGYVIIKNNEKKSVLDKDDILGFVQQFMENEEKVDNVMKGYSELKQMMEAK